ncbi:MAG: hypothetical protein AAFR27_09670, partial [Pseudomonadota bacterium]
NTVMNLFSRPGSINQQAPLRFCLSNFLKGLSSLLVDFERIWPTVADLFGIKVTGEQAQAEASVV